MEADEALPPKCAQGGYLLSATGIEITDFESAGAAAAVSADAVMKIELAKRTGSIRWRTWRQSSDRSPLRHSSTL